MLVKEAGKEDERECGWVVEGGGMVRRKCGW